MCHVGSSSFFLATGAGFQWKIVVVSWSEGGTSEVVGGNMMSSEDAAHLIS